MPSSVYHGLLFQNYMLCISLWNLITTVVRGGWNSVMVSISVCEVGHPGSSPAQSICISQKVEVYQCVINLFPPVLMTGLTGPCVIMSMW